MDKIALATAIVKSVGLIAYMVIEQKLGRTEHGSVLDLIKEIGSAILEYMRSKSKGDS